MNKESISEFYHWPKIPASHTVEKRIQEVTSELKKLTALLELARVVEGEKQQAEQ